jgi:hypothetical protein
VEVAGLCERLEVIEPGIVPVAQWRPDGTRDQADVVPLYGLVARKP